MNTKPLLSKTSQIRNRILKQIVSGKYADGKAIPSERILAESYEVSHATVREAVSQLVESGYLQRIQGKGTFVKEQNEKSELVNLLCYDMHGLLERDPFISDVLFGTHKAGVGASDSIKLMTIPKGRQFFEYFKGSEEIKPGASFIFAGYTPNADDGKFIQEEALNTVSIGTPFPGCKIPFVETDHYDAIYNAVKHLAELGHREIALMEINNERPYIFVRFDAFRKACSDFSCSGPILNLHEYSTAEAEILMRELITSGRKFTALIASGDRSTVGAIKTLRSASLRIPEDISVISYCDYDWIDDVAGIAITKIKQSVPTLAAEAYRRIKNKNTGEEPLVLKTRFIAGNSCRKI